jgi:hypothetical protein
MTLDEFSENLKLVGADQAASLPYDLYADLFPPGEPDDGARQRCYKFAQSHGFRIENKPDLQLIRFIRNA